MIKRGQGSLEYLIIIAAVLIVAGVTIMMVTGSVGASKQSVMYSSCQEAAVQCRMLKAANPNNPCIVCETQCVDPTTGIQLFDGAIDCCKAGASASIYEGATECEILPPGPSGIPCNFLIDCPTEECRDVDCIDGICKYTDKAKGTPCTGGECDSGECAPFECTVSRPCSAQECKDVQCVDNSCVYTNQDDGISCQGGEGECSGGSCALFECTASRPCSAQECKDVQCVDNSCVYTNQVDGTSCQGGEGQCFGGSCTTDFTTALAGDDQFRNPFIKSHSFSGGCAGNVTTSQVYSTFGLHTDSCEGSTYQTKFNNVYGAWVRRVSNIPAGVPLTVNVRVGGRIIRSTYSITEMNSMVFVSNVYSDDLGDGNWVQCGSFSNTYSSGGYNFDYTATCENVIASGDFTGDLFFAYAVNHYTGTSDRPVYSRLRYFDIDVDYGFEFKGEGIPGWGATSIDKYEWDFNDDGVYDWVSESSPGNLAYFKDFSLSRVSSNSAHITEHQIYGTSGLLAPVSGSYSYKTYYGYPTGTWYMKVKGVPMNTLINVSINSGGIFSRSTHSVSSVTSSVWISSVPSNNINDGNWARCGDVYSTSFGTAGTHPYSYSRTCENFPSSSSDLYIAHYHSHLGGTSDRPLSGYFSFINANITKRGAAHGNAYHVYPSPGTYTARLRVTDNLGVTAEDTISISYS